MMMRSFQEQSSLAALGWLSHSQHGIIERSPPPSPPPHSLLPAVAVVYLKAVVQGERPGFGLTFLACPCNRPVYPPGARQTPLTMSLGLLNIPAVYGWTNLRVVFPYTFVCLSLKVDSVLSSREKYDDTTHGTLTSVKTTLMQVSRFQGSTERTTCRRWDVAYG